MLIFAANLGEGIAQTGSPTQTEPRGISTRWARQSFRATEEALQKLRRPRVVQSIRKAQSYLPRT